jgi:hypothetical protein
MYQLAVPDTSGYYQQRGAIMGNLAQGIAGAVAQGVSGTINAWEESKKTNAHKANVVASLVQSLNDPQNQDELKAIGWDESKKSEFIKSTMGSDDMSPEDFDANIKAKAKELEDLIARGRQQQISNVALTAKAADSTYPGTTSETGKPIREITERPFKTQEEYQANTSKLMLNAPGLAPENVTLEEMKKNPTFSTMSQSLPTTADVEKQKQQEFENKYKQDYLQTQREALGLKGDASGERTRDAIQSRLMETLKMKDTDFAEATKAGQYGLGIKDPAAAADAKYGMYLIKKELQSYSGVEKTYASDVKNTEESASKLETAIKQDEIRLIQIPSVPQQPKEYNISELADKAVALKLSDPYGAAKIVYNRMKGIAEPDITSGMSGLTGGMDVLSQLKAIIGDKADSIAESDRLAVLNELKQAQATKR